MKRILLVAMAATLFAGFPALSSAGIITAGTNTDPTYVIGQEQPGVGFTGNLTPLNVPITVGSDSESTFDPFGAGFDSSDQIKFDPATVGPAAVNLNPNWVQFTASDGNPYSWALPAFNENEPVVETVGKWLFPGFTVVGGPLTYNILDEISGISDSIVISNNAQGVAMLQFYSDPAVVPEPSSLTLLALGISGLAGYTWRRRKAAVA